MKERLRSLLASAMQDAAGEKMRQVVRRKAAPPVEGGTTATG
jgi:hypothetical protein